MQISRRYQFEFGHPVERLWALVSDTPRWGEASGLPRYQVREELGADGSVKVFGEVEIAALKIAWEEPPGAWIAERWFEQSRRFTRGPMRRMITRAWLEDLGSRSRLEMELEFECKNLIGRLLARRLLAAYEGKVRNLLEAASRLIDAEQPQLFEAHFEPDPAQRRRAQQLAAEIDATPWSHGLAARLVDYIHGRQEVDLWSMRPIAIARQWRQPDQDVIELFLQSVRSGLLESRWDILCPRCRVPPTQISNMSDLPDGAHCDACNIDFSADFASNVELSFNPSPSVRSIENGYFCRSGPGVTPHVKAQCTLQPGERRRLPLALRPGEYRVRTLEAGGECDLAWSGGAFPAITIDRDVVGIDAESTAAAIDLYNAGAVARTVVIESRDWQDEVLTAEQATTLQVFRDLFSEQVLRPGDEVSIRNISFMFTDLVGSASIFLQHGDAEAYHLVRELFALLGDIVRRHHGNIVKTVGDGIHAAFTRPEDALRAALEMQQAMPDFNRSLPLGDSAIRIGLHAGRSIAVTLNDRLDYYGEAVNLAARLEGCGNAGDIIMSGDFTQDPGVADILRNYPLETRLAEIKGYAEPRPIVRLSLAAPAPVAAGYVG